MFLDDHQNEPPPLLTDIARKLMGHDINESLLDSPIFTTPDSPDQYIWRYMDFTKLVSMLHNHGLYLARSDLLGDPFEGSVPKANKLLLTALAATNNLPDDAYDGIGYFRKWARQWTFVNCWHMSDCESAAMWQLYSNSGEAIAIRSTFGRLNECTNKQCYIGQVDYLNYNNPTELIGGWHSLFPYVHKRRSYEHEKELRILIQEFPKVTRSDGLRAYDTKAVSEATGHWITMDLSKLITEIRISPHAAHWFKGLVKNVCLKYKLEIDVEQSTMDMDPLY